jgi:hypothetical protein
VLIEHINRDVVLSHLQGAAVVERDGNYMIDQSRYDVTSGRMLTERTILRAGQARRMRFFVRMFTENGPESPRSSAGGCKGSQCRGCCGWLLVLDWA